MWTVSLWFIAIGVADFFGHTFSNWFCAISGENLTMRLRQECFKKYMTLDMAYFDDPLHSTGVLKSRLATEASKVQHACSTNMKIMVKSSVCASSRRQSFILDANNRFNGDWLCYCILL